MQIYLSLFLGAVVTGFIYEGCRSVMHSTFSVLKDSLRDV